MVNLADESASASPILVACSRQLSLGVAIRCANYWGKVLCISRLLGLSRRIEGHTTPWRISFQPPHNHVLGYLTPLFIEMICPEETMDAGSHTDDKNPRQFFCR